MSTNDYANAPLAEKVALALSYSRNHLAASVHVREKEREHISGLCDLIEELGAALTSREAQGNDSGYVVCNGSKTLFRRWCMGPAWTADPTIALRFARRGDAETFSAEDEGAWCIVKYSEISCDRAPEGWFCTRLYGHEGPCAAWPLAAIDDGSRSGSVGTKPHGRSCPTPCPMCGQHFPPEYWCEACDAIDPRNAAQEAAKPTFQARVSDWMRQCFLPSLYSNMTERGDRLLEEVLELLQAHGYDQARVGTLVNYVYGRPVGEPAQEVGGVMVTLAGFCWIAGLDMHSAGEAELARITQPEVMAKIRAKQEAKNALHFDTPLPGEIAEDDQS